MPRIINAYDGNSALGDSLSKLGESIYGDQAQKELYRQKALEAKRGNDNADAFATAVRDGDKNNIGYYGALGNHTGADAAAFNQLATSNHVTDPSDPRMDLAARGAGAAFGSTAMGQGRSLANDSSIAAGHDATLRANNADTNTTTLQSADLTSKRQADTQLAIDGRTLAPIDNGDGTSHYDTKTNAASEHLPVPVTTEGVLGGVFRRAAANQQPGVDPFAGIDPRMLKKGGLDLPEQTLVHPQTGQTAISRDGGRTATLADGSTIPATGFLPVGQDAALAQARDNNVKASASQPLVVGNPANSQAAADARATSGLGPKVSTVLNAELGSIPGVPSVIQGIKKDSGGQIAPNVQGARQSQDLRNNRAMALMQANPGRQGTQQQEWIRDLFAEGSALSNPATEEAKIPKIVGALKGDYEQLRQLAIDPNTLPAERAKAVQQMHQYKKAIEDYSTPAASTAPPQAGAPSPPISGAQGQPPGQGPTKMMINAKGEKIGLVNNQWVPIP